MRAATQKRYQREYREFRIQCSVMYYVCSQTALHKQFVTVVVLLDLLCTDLRSHNDTVTNTPRLLHINHAGWKKLYMD